jgi:hypothetical protein
MNPSLIAAQVVVHAIINAACIIIALGILTGLAIAFVRLR